MGGRSTFSTLSFLGAARSHHHRYGRLACSEHVLVGYTQHHKTLAFGPRLFDTITFANFGETVNASVEFDENSLPEIGKIKNIRPDRRLSSEVAAFQLPEQLPEPFLSGRRLMTQPLRACIGGCELPLTIHHWNRPPPLRPSPQGGGEILPSLGYAPSLAAAGLSCGRTTAAGSSITASA